MPQGTLTLVAVDNEKGSRKTSPGGEEKGVEVYRVPTMVVAGKYRVDGRMAGSNAGMLAVVEARLASNEPGSTPPPSEKISVD